MAAIMDGRRLAALLVLAAALIPGRAAQPGETAGGPERRPHWSFAPVRRPDPPAPRGAAWARNPIDLFILERLEAAGLSPAPEADRAVLIRRLSLDLTGLPPSPEEVEAFAGDPRPDAYEALVERLLASPRHGERWAVHWLDAVRFAETHGFEMNQPRGNAWPYRDYVIRAFNEDRPYDRFIRDQLAGDALGEDAATGFLVAGPWDGVKSPEERLTREQRANELQDLVNAAGTVFLGLTLGCARCHDHKFDPILQREFYAVQAVFAGVEHGEREVEPPDREERERRAVPVARELAAVEKELWALEPIAGLAPGSPPRPAVSPLRNTDRFAPVIARRLRFTVRKTNNLEPCLDEIEVFTVEDPPRNVALAALGVRARSSSDYAGSELHKLAHLNDGRHGNSRSWISAEMGSGWVEVEFSESARIDRVVWGRDREGKFQDRLAIDYAIEVEAEDGQRRLVASAADRQPYGAPAAAGGGSAPVANAPGPFAELDARRRRLEQSLKELREKPRVYAGVFKEPPPTRLCHRGDPLEEREAVVPGAVAALGIPFSLPPGTPESQRRLALARWIADPANPLTARVMANRIWLHHFGAGLVATPSDFGAAGAPPSHPALLDWLAAELVASGWSLKALHRRIVMSSAYRQSSRPDPAGLAADAGCRLLWRFPPRRLEAEAIRDAILLASGKLDLAMGGPGFSAFLPNENYVRVYDPKREFGPADWRRMVYQTKVRMHEDGTFGAFDCPDAGQVCPRRPRSTTAFQSLNLLNSPFVLEQAGFLGARLRREAGDDAGRQVLRAFRLAFGRDPDPEELAAATRLVEGHGGAALARALFNSSEFLFIP
jgi:hypothetical protein